MSDPQCIWKKIIMFIELDILLGSLFLVSCEQNTRLCFGFVRIMLMLPTINTQNLTNENDACLLPPFSLSPFMQYLYLFSSLKAICFLFHSHFNLSTTPLNSTWFADSHSLLSHIEKNYESQNALLLPSWELSLIQYIAQPGDGKLFLLELIITDISLYLFPCSDLHC